MKSFLSKIFIPKYKDILNKMPDRKRGDGFEVIFNELEKTGFEQFAILETGTTRPGFSMEGDGSSTILFDEFVNFYNGFVHSIDINQEHCDFSRTQVSTKTNVHCSDSVVWLWNNISSHENRRNIDLFYLDSYDVDFSRPIIANMHHMKELACITPAFRKGTLIAIDDCQFDNNDIRIPAEVSNKIVGKGFMVGDFLNNIGAILIFDGYQKVWRL